jgi:hypothetical protein
MGRGGTDQETTAGAAEGRTRDLISAELRRSEEPEQRLDQAIAELSPSLSRRLSAAAEAGAEPRRFISGGREYTVHATSVRVQMVERGQLARSFTMMPSAPIIVLAAEPLGASPRQLHLLEDPKAKVMPRGRMIAEAPSAQLVGSDDLTVEEQRNIVAADVQLKSDFAAAMSELDRA